MNPTEEQDKIIEFPMLPLRVTAGAGTGKTTTMAWRLAAKVRAGQVEPERTLGITFTNNATAELAEAIRDSLGSDGAADVEVSTYHGFAHSIIREFGPLVGIPRSARVITPGYVRQILRESLFAKRRRHLDLTKSVYVIDKLRSLASALGNHLAAPDALIGLDDSPASDERDELAEVLVSFAARKRDLGVVDFSDLVAAAHRIVTAHPDVARRIRERYGLVLLDEYQDTNPAQRQLLRALFEEGFPITAVGDSDQTIYEWRGASPGNFERFPADFPNPDGTPAASLNLSKSWRSGSQIVAVANEVRAEITVRSPLPRLEHREEAEPGVIRTHWLANARAEATWISDRVRRLHDEEEYDWRDIAILFRKHQQMAPVRDALMNNGVPVEVASLGGLLDVPEITDLHAWLRILGRPDDAPALARVLLGSRFRLGLGDLAPLSEWVRKQRGSSPEASIGWAMLEAIDALDDVEGLSPAARARLAQFHEEYSALLAIAQGVSLVELTRRILDMTGAWTEIDALPEARSVSARLNTHRFLDLAEDWSPLEGRPSLDAFLDHLESLSEEGRAAELDAAQVSHTDAVMMTTVHAAKGMEWPVVILPAVAAGVFPAKPRRHDDPEQHADVIPDEIRLDRHSPATEAERRAAREDEEWRAAYVATTRAARQLIVTGAWWYTMGRQRKPSRLFEVIDRIAEHEPDRADETTGPPVDLLAPQLSEPTPDPHFPNGAPEVIRAAVREPDSIRRIAADAGIESQYDDAVRQLGIELDGLPEPPELAPTDQSFRTSVTGLVTFASCPLRFRWGHLDRLPRRPSEAAARGVELHRRIELFNRGTMAFDEASPEFYDDPGSEEPPRGAFSRFRESRFAGRRPLLIEAPFELRVADSAVAGRIDAVYAEPDCWEIVDFKSGRPSVDPTRRVQLEAYAIAATDIALQGHERPPSLKVTFAYFGGDGPVEESEDVDPSWLDRARTHLHSLVDAAAAGPYEATPSAACRTCDFLTFCEAGTDWVEGSS